MGDYKFLKAHKKHVKRVYLMNYPENEEYIDERLAEEIDFNKLDRILNEYKKHIYIEPKDGGWEGKIAWCYAHDSKTHLGKVTIDLKTHDVKDASELLRRELVRRFYDTGWDFYGQYNEFE